MNIQCPICMFHYKPSDSIDVTTCGHVFHETCLNQWTIRTKTCPQCRTSLIGKIIRGVKFSTSVVSTDKAEAIKDKLADARRELNNLNKEIKENQKESIELEKTDRVYLEKVLDLRCAHRILKQTMNNADSEIESLQKKIIKLVNMEKTVQEKTEQLEGMDHFKFVENSAVDTKTILKSKPSPRLLAEMVVKLRSERTATEQSKCNARNSLNACQDENQRLQASKRNLLTQIHDLEKDSRQLENYFFQNQYNLPFSQPKTTDDFLRSYQRSNLTRTRSLW